MAKIKENKDSGQSKLKVIWFFLKPYKLHIAILAGLSVLIGVFEAAFVGAIYPIVSLGLNIESGQDNFFLSALYKLAAIFPMGDMFISYCILFILLALAIFIVKLISTYFRIYTSSKITMQSQEKIFERQIHADYQYFLDRKQGDLVYATTTAPDRGILHLINSATKLISETILILFILILLFSIFWQGTIALILMWVAYYFATQRLGVNISYAAGAKIAEASARQHIILNEVFNGIKQIKVFLKQSGWLENFTRALRQYRYNYRRSSVWNEIPTLVISFLAFCAIGIVGLIMRTQNPVGIASWLPIFGTFTFAFLRLLGPISNFGALRMTIMTTLPDVEIVYSAINKRFDNIKDGTRELDSFTSNIQLDHVSFTHKGRSITLDDVSISFEKGKTTAIVGPSGGGKTTIVDLLLRLFDPDTGEIKIDDVDLKEYKLSSWLSRIGFVSQDTFIFHNSVKNNITFGTDRYSDKETVQAAKSANAHDFILEFPQGYDTVVGERGMKLSGGQKQRIAIARAIIKKPEILILDEATSALDNVSEALVQEAIEKISAERTVIIVAHRLSTIINADKIIVLVDGRIMEEGKHRELMARRGAYWSLYKGQENM